MESELEYANKLSEHTSYYDTYVTLPIEQPAPEAPTDIPIVVPTPLIDMAFLCCPDCEVLNEPVTELVPVEEPHPIVLPTNNQGHAARRQVVCTGQHGHHGGHSDH